MITYFNRIQVIQNLTLSINVLNFDVMSHDNNYKNFSIKLWAEDDRPREKLLLKGKTSLSDAELIAILISTGTREDTAVGLAKKILLLASNNINELGKFTVNDLKKIKGIGEAKAISIIAALELGRRRKDEQLLKKQQIVTSKDIFDYFNPILSDYKHEEFWILILNRSNKIICSKRISEGGVNGTVADPKIIFKLAIEELGSSIILCHNHPSGNINPSEEDIRLTQKIQNAGKFLDIHVIDHIIIGGGAYYSFNDQGVI
jgi:DNA repair protein RadC